MCRTKGPVKNQTPLYLSNSTDDSVLRIERVEISRDPPTLCFKRDNVRIANEMVKILLKLVFRHVVAVCQWESSVKLLVSVWSADCEENNEQAMLKLSQMRRDCMLPSQIQFLLPTLGAMHVAKYLKGSFANWFLYKDGERFNLSILRTLYNNRDPQIKKKMRITVTLSAVRNRDRMSVPYLLTINKEFAREIVTSVP